MQNPRAIGPAADSVLSGQGAHRAGHCRAMSADEVRQPLMRERQRHGDALGQNPSPALGQVPEREQQPIIDSLMVSDRKRDRERVSAARPSVEELQPELWPWGHPYDQPMIEYGQPCRLQDDPADLRLNVGSLLVPAPRPDHVAGAEQFHASTSKHFDFSADQSVDDKEALMMGVELLCRRDVPIALGQVPDPGPRFATSAFTVAGRDQIFELRISINDADRIDGNVQMIRSPPQRG